MSWYVRKTTKPSSLEQTVYYSFEKKETQSQEHKKQVKQPSHNDKTMTEKDKQPKKRKPTTPLPANSKSVKRKNLEKLTEETFLI